MAVLLDVAYARLLVSCSHRRSSWGTSVLGAAMRLKLHPSRAAANPPHTTMRLVARAIARPKPKIHRADLFGAAGRRHLTNNGFFRVSEEVREALHSKKPVVALETTIYTHGIFPKASPLLFVC